MQTVFRNERKYIIFWAIWGAIAIACVRWMITDPIVQALTATTDVVVGCEPTPTTPTVGWPLIRLPHQPRGVK